MLYLEDYLEMIENLPMEMRDRLTEMREMDLQVQNSMDSLEDRVKKFFEKCRTIPSLKQEWKDDHFKKIKEDYHKALEDEDEKVQLTAQIYDLLERYLRKLDMELQKFKLELEADNAGITEVLEKRSLELDNPQNNTENHRGEKRKSTLMMGNGTEKRRSENPDKLLSSVGPESTPRDGTSSHRGGGGTGGGGGVAGGGSTGSTASSPAVTMLSSSASTPALSYSLGTVGAGSNAAIAAAASRAIAATSEMPQGRRSASMKASYEAMLNSDADLASSLGLSRQFSGSRGGVEATTPQSAVSQKSRNKKSAASRLQQQQQATTSQTPSAAPINQSQLAQQLQQPVVETPPPPTEVVTETVVDEGSNANWQVDPIDPNEPRYCICNEVSYGDMVGCDNEDCPIEWFHYGCVGLTQAPRGKWYCPQCTVAMKRRGRR